MKESQQSNSENRAVELLAEFLHVSHSDVAAEFDSLCAKHLPQAGELRRLFGLYQDTESLVAAHGHDQLKCHSANASVFSCKAPKQRPEPAPGLQPGMVLGDFRLLEPIGQGGMGVVWEAQQLSLGNRSVAIKFVLPERVSPRQLDFFRREARAGGRLSHPCIVAVHAYGEEGSLAWIAMEYIPGSWTLCDAIEQVSHEKKVPSDYERNVAILVAQVAEAMQTAHEAGVIHRDLKPQNILVTADDQPKVTDFGLARITDESAISNSGEVGGSYYYMSPEQIRARKGGIDHRTDVFSLGATLYELLTLHRPFEGETALDITRKILSEPPRAPGEFRASIDSPLAAICMRALEKDPDARFQSMREMADALRAWSENSLAPPTGHIPRNRRKRRMAWKRITLLAIASTALAWGWSFRESWQGKPKAHPIVWHARRMDPRLMNQNYAKLIDAAHERISEAEQRLSDRAASDVPDPLRTILNELEIPSVTVQGERSLSAALNQIPELSELEIITSVNAENAVGEHMFELDLQFPITGQNLLDVLLYDLRDRLGWTILNGSVVILPLVEMQPQCEVESYLIWDLVSPITMFYEGKDDTEFFIGEGVHQLDSDSLITLIIEAIATESWDAEGPSAECNSNSLVVFHRPQVRDDIADFLTDLRHFYFGDDLPMSMTLGSEPPGNTTARGFPMTLQPVLGVEPGGSVHLDDILDAVEKATGMDAIKSAGLDQSFGTKPQAIQLSFPWESAKELLDGAARISGSFEWSIQSGVIVLDLPWLPNRRYTRVYHLWDLATLPQSVVDAKRPSNDRLRRTSDFELEEELFGMDNLDELIRETISSESWDQDSSNWLTIDENCVMFVRQTAEVHAELETLLASIRHSSGR